VYRLNLITGTNSNTLEREEAHPKDEVFIAAHPEDEVFIASHP